MISLTNFTTLIKRSCLLIAFFYLTACSYSPDALRNTYSEMAASISDDLTESVDFNAEQTTKIDEYAKQLMQWHRQNKLPSYSQDLSKLASLISNDTVTESSLKPIIDLVDNAPHFEQSGYISQKLAEVARSLTTLQVNQIEATINNEHQQAALEIQRIHHSKEIRKGLQHLFRFLGVYLGAEQQQIITAESSKFHDLRQQELEAEIVNDNKLLALLRNPEDAQFVPRFVQQWNSQGSQLTGQAQQLELSNKRKAAILLSKLINSMDSQQKSVLSQKLFSVSQTLALMANE